MPPVRRSQIKAHEIHRGMGQEIRLSLALSTIEVTGHKEFLAHETPKDSEDLVYENLVPARERQTIDGCVCNGLMSTEPGKLIGTMLSFQRYHTSVCGTMMAAFVLEVNTAFQSAISNDIVD
ncbi:hypothetical protein TNCV_1021741 [Trichonephila clavipes]|uniref:Uncharacterized protein n=1 Tax=Trichonephila clavipes TaxID=2585209 RepID=A0A8X6VNI0_TRICX|nr:hypothetical protein TNCV_1021741 [Trichonephila clavipes]